MELKFMYVIVLFLLIAVVVIVKIRYFTTGANTSFSNNLFSDQWGPANTKAGKRIIRRHIYLRKPRVINITKTNSDMKTSRHERAMNSVRSRVEYAMVNQKRYIDPYVKLDTLACELGTNRTYMSRVINEEHRKSFKRYINDHRFGELMRQLIKNPNLTREELVQLCGFNSISTMVRVVKANTGCTFREWKKRLLDNKSKEDDES
jgi:AraC-like DNA-binding protein